jgi:integrase
MMLGDLSALLASGHGEEPDDAVVAENLLAKPSARARAATLLRLRQLYGVGGDAPLCVALRRLWARESEARPVLALLCALARDPLLRDGGRRERRLRDDEYAALGAALTTATDDAIWAPGVAAIQFMLVTEWRRGEVLGLRWSEVDLARRTANLADTKTGASMRAIAEAGCMVLRAMPRGGEMVFPAPGGDVPMAGFRRVWARIVHRIAGLPGDITPHVLRHSYASLAADLGLADSTIGALLGHRGQTITRRYIHSADAALLVAADVVAGRTVELMAGMVEPAHPAQASPTSPV